LRNFFKEGTIMAKAKKPAKAAKKKPVKAKSAPKKAAKKPAAKPAAKKATKKPVAKKATKPVVKKAAPKKLEIKKTVQRAAVEKKETSPKKVTIQSKPVAKTVPVVPNISFFPPITQRPIAHKPANKPSVPEDKTRYSEEELKEFEALILEKLEKARNEYRILKETLNRNNDEGTDATSGGNTKVLEDGAETAEKENLSQLAARQQKYITNLENALVRIKNGTYGICSVTGKLIPKERLIAVPHTTQSIEAKMMKND
jgi:RNA polymerase-binding transcription factor DksA